MYIYVYRLIEEVEVEEVAEVDTEVNICGMEESLRAFSLSTDKAPGNFTYIQKKIIYMYIHICVCIYLYI
jgi:hypothetical protein